MENFKQYNQYEDTGTIASGDTLTGDLITKYKIYTPPEVVGGYRIGKRDISYVQFNLSYKPSWLHRQIMKLCLGWYWYDAK